MSINRALRPAVDFLRLNRMARPIWAFLWSKGSQELIRVRVNGREWWLHPTIALLGDYELNTIRWLRGAIRPGMTVFDIGANVGLITLEMAHLVGSSGRVYAIEPAASNATVLKRHIARNGFSDRVVVVEAACCSRHRGSARLELEGNGDKVDCGFQMADAGLRRNPLSHGSTHTHAYVSTITVDMFCEELGLEPQVIKIDVEGAEVEVLKGAENILKRVKPAIIFGFHPFAFDEPSEAQRSIEEMFASAGIMMTPSESYAWSLAEYTTRS